MPDKNRSIVCAVLAAACYGISAPVSKLLLNEMPPTFMAAMLYLGAGLGMVIINIVKSKEKRQKEAALSKKDFPYTIAMILLDIAAPIFLMIGLATTTSATASLLNNFEIVATAVIALLFFKETVGKRMWIAISCITLASILLSVGDFSRLSFSFGSVFVLLACMCWGLENNCTRMLSLKDPLQIVMIKGICSGTGALLISLILNEYTINLIYIGVSLVLGFVAYGLSIYLYILAQRELGAVRTSAYYAVSPFIGVILSFIVFKEMPAISFIAALIIMVFGTYFTIHEKHDHWHTHSRLQHEHRHQHNDAHHNHEHNPPAIGTHSHMHTHPALAHKHSHTPDLHHTHTH